MDRDPADAADPAETSATTGLVLAAGAGRRYGGPKALARDGEGVAWVRRVVRVLREGGCPDVVVVLGAGAAQARALVPVGAAVVEAVDWSRGLAHSLVAGLDAVAEDPAGQAQAVLVVPVDVPALPAAVVTRVLTAGAGTGSGVLVRATFDGRPGHPVLLGARHWAGLRVRLLRPHGRGDTDGHAAGGEDVGAGPHLPALAAAAGTAVTAVECGDLWDGRDVDTR